MDNDDDVDDDDDDVPYSAVKHETFGVSVIFHPWKGLHFKGHSHAHGIHVQYIHQIWLICVVNVGFCTYVYICIYMYIPYMDPMGYQGDRHTHIFWRFLCFNEATVFPNMVDEW